MMNLLIHNRGRRDDMIIKWMPFRYFYTYLLLLLGPLIIPPLMAAGTAIAIPFYMLMICCEIRGDARFLIPLAWIFGTVGLYAALGLAIAFCPIALVAYYLVFFTLTCLLLFE